MNKCTGFQQRFLDPLMRKILIYTMLKIPVNREDFLEGVAIKTLELDGIVFLQNDGLGSLHFQLPFVFFYLYNSILKIVPQDMVALFSYPK